MNKVLTIALLVIISISIMIPGCSKEVSPSPSSTTTGPQGELVYAVPSLGSEDFSWKQTIDFSLNEIVYETLTRTNINGAEKQDVYPWLAESWTHSDDCLTYDFYLREGIQWHEGWGEVTADDVVFTYDQVKDPNLKNLYNYMFAPPEEGGYMASCEAIDRYHVRFHMSIPYKMLSLDMTDEPLAVICKKYIEQVGWEEASKHPIGTSPWFWVETVHGDHIKFQAVDNDWMGRKPQFKYLTLKLVPDLSTQLMMLESGQADMAILSPGQIDEAQQAGLKVFNVPNERFVSIYFGGQLMDRRDTYDPTVPWAPHTDESADSDWNQRALKVREALCLSINKQAIIDKIMYNYARPGTMRDFNTDWAGYLPEWKPYTYDPEKARTLLAEAGYANGFEKPIQVLIPNVSVAGIDTKAIAMTVADCYEAIGLEVERVVMDQNLIDDMWRYSWDSAWKSMVSVGFSIIDPLWGASWARYSYGPLHEMAESPTYDRIIEEWIAALDAPTSLELSQELGTYSYDNYVECGIFESGLLYVFGPKVKGVSKMPYLQEAYMIPFFNYEDIQRAE